MTDARAWRIQKRLLHISLQMSDGHHNSPKEKKPVPHTSPLNVALANLDHDIITGNDGWQECTKCCQRWHMRQRRSIIERGKCPGIPVWDPGPIPEIPRLAPKGSELVYGSKIVHRSHRIAYNRGLVICLKCGALSHGTRVVHLNEVCFGKPRGAWARGCLRNFRQGRHPSGDRGKWPKRRRDPVPEEFREVVI